MVTKKIHETVLFVGDRPNPRKNLDLEVAFVGTTSYKTLLEWIYKLDVDINNVIMVNAFEVSGRPSNQLAALGALSKYRTIALGANAARAVAALGYTAFQLPHPSDLNREKNDKKKLNERLAKCRVFIYEGRE